MAKLDITPNQTRLLDLDTETKIQQSHKGMAHFAGTGPDGKVCRHCVHWQFGYNGDWYAKGRIGGQKLKPQPCAKNTELAKAAKLPVTRPLVPYDVAACKYFEQRDDAPTIMRPKKTYTS